MAQTNQPPAVAVKACFEGGPLDNQTIALTAHRLPHQVLIPNGTDPADSFDRVGYLKAGTKVSVYRMWLAYGQPWTDDDDRYRYRYIGPSTIMGRVGVTKIRLRNAWKSLRNKVTGMWSK